MQPTSPSQAPSDLVHDFQIPPMPRSLGDMIRWDHTRLRRRLMSGRWAPDLEFRMKVNFGDVRRQMMGPKSMAKNTFRKVCNELAVNYLETPGCKQGGGDLPVMFGAGGLCERVGLWPLMRHVQPRLIGLREMFVGVQWSTELGRPAIRPVTPDVTYATAWDCDPSLPVELVELRWRNVPRVGGRWCWDEWSIMDPGAPHFRVLEAKNDGGIGEDLTGLCFGRTFEGDAYDWRWTQGARAGDPFLPFATYHARRGDDVYDAFEGVEVVDGSLDVACAWSFVLHAMFRASWPQRYALGAYVAGAAPRNTAAGPRVEVPVDPTTVVHFEADPNVQNPTLGQWGPASDPELLARTTGMLDRAVADMDGLDASHVIRDSANPWSAAALSITREGKRQAQAQYTPELRPSDLDLLEKLAATQNLWGPPGPALPESGYSIEYRSLPLSAEEAQLRREHNATMIAQGRMSIVEAYQSEHPGTTRDEARAELERIADENAQFGVVAGSAPSPLLAGAAAAGNGSRDPAKVADILGRVKAGQLSPASALAVFEHVMGFDDETAKELLAGEEPESAAEGGETPEPPAMPAGDA